MYIIISRVATPKTRYQWWGFHSQVRSMNSRAWVRDGAEFSEVRGNQGTWYFWERLKTIYLNNTSWIYLLTIKSVWIPETYPIICPSANYADTGRIVNGYRNQKWAPKRESSTFCRKSEVWINKNKPDK